MLDESKTAVAARIQEIFDSTSDTLEQFGAVADVSKQAAKSWLKTGKIGKLSLSLICRHYGFRSYWVLTGELPRKPVDMLDANAVTPTPPRTGHDVMKAAEPAAQYASASEKARLLSDTILACSGKGYISDDVIDAMFTIVNATHAAVPDDLLDELKKDANDKIKRRG